MRFIGEVNTSLCMLQHSSLGWQFLILSIIEVARLALHQVRCKKSSLHLDIWLSNARQTYLHNDPHDLLYTTLNSTSQLQELGVQVHLDESSQDDSGHSRGALLNRL